MCTDKFMKAVARLGDQFPDDLLPDDWDVLANVLMAYIWNDDFKNDLQSIANNYLGSRDKCYAETAKALRADSTRIDK